MEKYVTMPEPQRKVSHAVHIFMCGILASSSAPFLDTRRDDGVKLSIAGIYIFESPVFLVQSIISYFAIERTD